MEDLGRNSELAQPASVGDHPSEFEGMRQGNVSQPADRVRLLASADARPQSGASTDHRSSGDTNSPSQIDLPTALKLAGARNLDVQIARQRLEVARANLQSANQQFFPWLTPGVTYHRRDGSAQAVPSGVVSDAHFDSWAPGVTAGAQWNLGDALYNQLAARQITQAADHRLATQQLDATRAAAQGYLELARARMQVGVIQASLNLSEDYQRQLHEAVSAGIAFKGDELRVRSQTERLGLSLRRAQEQQRLAAASLAELLHLDPQIDLIPLDSEPIPVSLFEPDLPMDRLVQQALRERPEWRESDALIAAAKANQHGASRGPWIPTLGAQIYGGGLGGGPDGKSGHFGAEGDYTVGLSWKIGPGGLFDEGRLKSTQARLVESELTQARLKDTIIAQVVTGVTRVQSLREQLELARRNVATATEAEQLARDRKQFGVGVVLEDLQAQQELFQARSDYLGIVAEFNKQQYGLLRAVGAAPSGNSSQPDPAIRN